MNGSGITMADLAADMGISLTAVSRALSGKPGVSDQLRAQIIERARQLGYRKAVTDEAAAASRPLVGVLVTEHFANRQSSYYQKMYEYLKAYAQAENQRTSLCLLTEEMTAAMQMPPFLGERAAAGMVLMGPMDSAYFTSITQHSPIPYVCLDTADEEHELDSVLTDNFFGMYQMTRYLLARGHRKIRFVGTVGSTEAITDRYYGFVKAMEEYALKTTRAEIIPDRATREGYGFKMQLPDDPELPTAFVCNCDQTAAKVITLLEERGLNVPKDISVVGFDGYLYPGLCDVALTSYAVDMEGMASHCIRLLGRKIRKEAYKRGVRIIEGQLAERQSVRALAAHER